MDAIALVKLVLMTGIVLTVLSIGLCARPADTLLLLRNPKLGVRAMASMFVLTPLFVIGLAWAVQLGPADRAALIALSISPMPPILPRRQAMVGGGGDYAVGLSVLAAVASIVVTPIVAWLVGRLFGVTTIFDPVALRVLAITVVVPLAAGILIARLWPSRPRPATRASPFHWPPPPSRWTKRPSSPQSCYSSSPMSPSPSPTSSGADAWRHPPCQRSKPACE